MFKDLNTSPSVWHTDCFNYKEMEALRMEQWDLSSGSALSSNQLTSDSLCLFRVEFYFLYVIMFKVSQRYLSREVACANIT